ncbi:MAG: protein translocase subunit SecF [Candidatus Spechtbacterales bacterium]
MLKYRKYFYILSGTLITASIFSIALFGLRFGTDFKGGSMMELSFEGERPSHEKVQKAFLDFDLGEIIVQDTGERGLILRFREVSATLHEGLLNKLKTLGGFEEQRFESIGPVIGKEVQHKSFWAMGLVLLMILLYIAWAFRNISYPVRSWVYSVIALLALFHDILVTIGIFSLLSYFFPMEVNVPFVAALLTILGYSVNDTIIIFDRIRENVLRQGSTFDFGAVIEGSVRQTFVRSLNTSLSVLIALIALFIFGGETISSFILALIIGVVAGSYSSLFLAAPLLFSWSMLKIGKR